MYRIAVCDDEAVSRNGIIENIANIQQLKDAEVREYTDGKNLMYDINDRVYFDIIILDICMKDMDGILTAEKIRDNTVCSGSELIFVSSYKADVAKVVDVNPMGYVFKPITAEVLTEKLYKALNHILKTRGTLEFTVGRVSTRVKISDIVFIESWPRGVKIYTFNENYRTYSFKISDIADNISSSDFIRCHNSYVINTKYIKRIRTDTIELYNGRNVPISRKYKDDILNFLERT